MSNDWFFEKFALIADAPGAVDRMRELVLELAFCGKLSDNGYHNDNVSGHWTTKTVEEIATSITPGFACSRNHQDEHGYVHLRTHNISTEGNMNFDLLVRVNTNMIDPRKSSLSAGDVLFNNTNSQDLVGKTCLVDKDYNFAFSNHITRIKLYDDTFPAFFVYYLTQLRNKGYFSRICTRWINQAAVNTDALKKLQIPLPPLAEQKRIVAKVDELMGLCDVLEAQQQERELRKSVLIRSSLSRFSESPTSENLGYLFHNSYDIPPSELRKSILTLAVQGKLVPQDPENEPADVLIERIITEKSALVNGKLMRSSNSHTTRDIDQIDGELPHGWAWTRIEEITSIGTGSTPLKSEKDYYANGDIPWVTSAATNNYFINEPDQFVTRKALKDYNLRIYPKGSLVIALYGQGKTRGQVGQLMFDATTNQACAVLEFFESGKSVRDYIRLFFLKKYDELRERAAGAAQPNLSGGMIRLTRVPLPPLAEQHRIVAKVDQLMALVDELERQQAASREKASNLLDAIVHEMTSGV
jgi:type I restriction enzyme S subunit